MKFLTKTERDTLANIGILQETLFFHDSIKLKNAQTEKQGHIVDF